MTQKTLDQYFTNLPEVQAGRGMFQNKFHQFDVFVHSLQFVKHVKKLTDDPDIIAAGYLHDIGKPVVATPKYKNGVLQERAPGKPYHSFDNHENVGGDMVREMDNTQFKRFGLNQDRIADLVACHYIPMKGIKKIRKATTYDQFVENVKELEQTLDSQNVTREEVLTMFLADKLAQGKYCTDRDELFAIREVLLNQGNLKLQDIYQMQQEAYHK